MKRLRLVLIADWLFQSWWQRSLSFWKFLVVLAMAIGLVVIAGVTQPLWAAEQADLTPLTPELLQERLRNLSASEGVRVIDLRHMTLDLRPENAT
ncbi:MAG TPA: hypothetical protein V6C46_01710, partial [Coleofasciculaceae cyanobacterium]